MQSPITHDQLVEICKVMDMNKDGLVDLNEFLETFRLVDQEHRIKDTQKTNDELNGNEIKNHSPNKIEIQTNSEEQKQNLTDETLIHQEHPKKKLRRESLGIDKGDYNWEYTRTLAELQYQNVGDGDENIHSTLSNKNKDVEKHDSDDKL